MDARLAHTVRNRLDLIEELISEGRRTTEHFGVYFVIWGVAHVVGFFASAFFAARWVWHLAIPGCLLIELVRTRGRGTTRTIAGQAVASVWLGGAVALTLLSVFALPRGEMSWTQFDLCFFALMGAANFVCAQILRWTLQRLVAFAWWLVLLVAIAIPDWRVNGWLFLASAVGLELGFGAYLMWRDRRAA